MDPPKRLDLGYSLKNIPIPSPTAYTTRLFEKVEDLIKRMRWRAFFFLKNEQAEEEQDRKERFGFRTRKGPFENDLLKIIEDLQFRKTSNELQERLRQDTERIKKSKDVIVPADKTRNLYAVSKTRYEKLLCENITKAYKPAPARTYDEINYEAKGIAESFEISERINCMAKNEAFITLKDHKDNFSNALPCRLINPAKSEIGRISKAALDRILTDLNQKLPLNMWRNTAAVTNWFSSLERKHQCTFFCFDIVDFYPSITERLLNQALDFARQYVAVSPQDREVILHARKSMLFGQGKEWMKKGTGLFDVTMGCFDGAEVCQLVGAFVLATLSKAVPSSDIGLYRDDGLGALRNTPGTEVDRIRKDVIRIFGELGLRITIQTNLKVADFLDATFNLNTESYYPYRKPNDRPVYIHCQSNHPPNIIKNLPASISRRLTDISSNEAVFEDAKPMHDNALADSGFGERTEFLSDRKGDHEKKKRKNRRRNIT